MRSDLTHLIASSEFSRWAEAWRGEQGAWWRFAITCIAFVAGVLVTSWFARSAQFVDANPDMFVREVASAGFVGVVFLVGLTTFFSVKRILSPKRPSVLSAPGRTFSIGDTFISALIWLSLLAMYLAGSGQLAVVESRIESYSAMQWTALLLVLALALGAQAASEEIVFRGYMLPRIAAWSTPIVGALMSAAIFAGAHIGATAWGYVVVLALGVATALSVQATANIGAAVGLHAANNCVGVALYSLGRSAQPSPEQALSLVGLVVAWLACVVAISRRKQMLAIDRSRPAA